MCFFTSYSFITLTPDGTWLPKVSQPVYSEIKEVFESIRHYRDSQTKPQNPTESRQTLGLEIEPKDHNRHGPNRTSDCYFHMTHPYIIKHGTISKSVDRISKTTDETRSMTNLWLPMSLEPTQTRVPRLPDIPLNILILHFVISSSVVWERHFPVRHL